MSYANGYKVTITDDTVITITLKSDVVDLVSFCGYQVQAYSGAGTGTSMWRTVTFPAGTKLSASNLSAVATKGTVTTFEYWDNGVKDYKPVTGDLTIGTTAGTTWVRVTVVDGSATYKFVLNTVYQA